MQCFSHGVPPSKFYQNFGPRFACGVCAARFLCLSCNAAGGVFAASKTPHAQARMGWRIIGPFSFWYPRQRHYKGRSSAIDRQGGPACQQNNHNSKQERTQASKEASEQASAQASERTAKHHSTHASTRASERARKQSAQASKPPRSTIPARSSPKGLVDYRPPFLSGTPASLRPMAMADLEVLHKP